MSGNTSPFFRKFAGQMYGMFDAHEILTNLAPDEKVKVITHSMGGAFARGFLRSLKFYASHVLEWTDEQIDNTFEFELDIAMYDSGSRMLKTNMKNTFQAGRDTDVLARNEDIKAGEGKRVTRLKVRSTSDNKNFKDHSIRSYDMKDLLKQVEKILNED